MRKIVTPWIIVYEVLPLKAFDFCSGILLGANERPANVLV